MLASELGNSIMKYKRPLMAFLALSILLCSLYVNVNQSYTAEIYIKYLGDDVKDGIAADGSHLNPYEIKNALVVRNTLEALQLDWSNQEQIRRSITVAPVYTITDEEKHASWLDNFSDYGEDENRPGAVYYSVKFQTDIGPEFASRFLDTLIEQYRAFYVEKHAYSTDVIMISDTAVMKYDYFETADMLKTKIKGNSKYLNNILTGDKDYRSPETGYAISDLVAEYNRLLECDLAAIGQDIFDRGLSKNNVVLQTTLAEMADRAQLNSERNATKADSHKTMMDIYSDKNDEYTWETSQEASKGGSEQVREDTERDKTYVREETTYDKLILEYVDYGATGVDEGIDAEYYNEYVEYFEKPGTVDEEIEIALNNVCVKYNDLHAITEATIKDYNKFKAARYITDVSGVSVLETMSEFIYYAVSVVFPLALGIVYIIFVELKKKKKI